MCTAKPRLDTACVASRYANPDERVAEVGIAGSDDGCLVAFSSRDGLLVIDVYSATGNVAVRAGAGVRVLRAGARNGKSIIAEAE